MVGVEERNLEVRVDPICPVQPVDLADEIVLFVSLSADPPSRRRRRPGRWRIRAAACG